MKLRFILLIISLAGYAQIGQCARIKDIVDIQGMRGNPLTGIGLVTGLSNTGDSSLPSAQMLANLLKDYGLDLSRGQYDPGAAPLERSPRTRRGPSHSGYGHLPLWQRLQVTIYHQIESPRS